MILIVQPGHMVAFLHDLTSRPGFASDEYCINLQDESSE
jgi:hypothetical protein